MVDCGLPCRQSGASDAPMPAREAVLFESPPSVAVELVLPNRGRVVGMGIRKGVTLIVGGGFHGKTTLLKALEAGVYNKVCTHRLGQLSNCAHVLGRVLLSAMKFTVLHCSHMYRIGWAFPVGNPVLFSTAD